jgi:hypothetical protein
MLPELASCAIVNSLLATGIVVFVVQQNRVDGTLLRHLHRLCVDGRRQTQYEDDRESA